MPRTYKVLTDDEKQSLYSSIMAELTIFKEIQETRTGRPFRQSAVDTITSHLAALLNFLSEHIDEDEVLEYCVRTVQSPNHVLFKIHDPEGEDFRI